MGLGAVDKDKIGPEMSSISSISTLQDDKE